MRQLAACAAQVLVMLVPAALALAQQPPTDRRSELVARPLTDTQPLSRQPRLFLQRFEIEGATRWSETELRDAVLREFEGREIDSEELEIVRRRLTRWYVDHGYFNSGVLIPDQNVTDGVVRLRVLEGRLTQIEIIGNRNLDAEYLVTRLQRAATQPFEVQPLLDRMRRLQDVSIVERLRGSLGPGDTAAGARLTVRVDETPLWQFGTTVANNRSPAIGPIRTRVHALNRSVTGIADTLHLQYGLSRGLDDFGIEYARPVNTHDTTVTLKADSSDALVVEAPYSELDIRSRTRSIALTVSHPLQTAAGDVMAIGATFDRRRSDSSLLGLPFSFSPGAIDGRSVVTALRLWTEASRRSAGQALALRGSLNYGFDALGSTINPSGPDSRFLSLQAQAQWAFRANDQGGVQWVGRADLQWTRDPLLAIERLAVGGVNTVRGYRENLLVRDMGIIVSVEGRFPIGRLMVPAFGREHEMSFYVGPFIDYAMTRNRQADTPDLRWLGSTGLSLRANIARHLNAELHWGRGWRRLETRGHDLQDRGIHFMLAVQTR